MTQGRPGDGTGDYVTVARRLDPIAAELVRGRLAADGIPAHLADVHLVQTYNLWAAALGGVRVMVPASWAPQALRAIAALEQGELALDELGPASGAEAPEDDDPAPAARPGRAPVVSHVALGAAALLLLCAIASALGRSAPWLR